MKRDKVFEVNYNSDSIEGRGASIPLAYFPNKREAERVVDDPRFSRWCVMGYHKPGEQRYQIREKDMLFFDTAEEFWEKHDTENKKMKALAKLTAEERKLLGLE